MTTFRKFASFFDYRQIRGWFPLQILDWQFSKSEYFDDENKRYSIVRIL